MTLPRCGSAKRRCRPWKKPPRKTKKEWFSRGGWKNSFFFFLLKITIFFSASLALLRCLSRPFRPRRDARRSFCRDCWEAEKKRSGGVLVDGKHMWRTHLGGERTRRRAKKEEGAVKPRGEGSKKKTLLLSSSPASPSLFPLPLFLSPSLSLSTHTGHAKENENHTGSVGQSVSQNTRGHGSA